MENVGVPADGFAAGTGFPVLMQAPAMAPSGSFQPPAPQVSYFPPPVPFNANTSAQAGVVNSTNAGLAQPCCGNCPRCHPANAPINPPKYFPFPPVNNSVNVPPGSSSFHFGLSKGPAQLPAIGMSNPNPGMTTACPARNFPIEPRGYPTEPPNPMRFPPLQRSAPAPPAFNSALPAYTGFDIHHAGLLGRYPPPLHPVPGATIIPQFPHRTVQDFPKAPTSNGSYGSQSMVPPMPFNAPFQGVMPPFPSAAPLPALNAPPPAPKLSDDDLASQLGFLSINPRNDTTKSPRNVFEVAPRDVRRTHQPSFADLT